MNKPSIDPKTYTRRNTNRLDGYDYSSSGAYFITICAEKRQRVLEIPLIRTALLEKCHQLPHRFPGVQVDVFVIMPDHVHGILWLDGTVKDAPTLGKVVGLLKDGQLSHGGIITKRQISPVLAITGREIIMSM